MEPNQVRAITGALVGMTYEEWRSLRDKIEQEFETARSLVQFTTKDGADVLRLTAMENEWPYAADAPAQTRMGF